MRRRSAVYNFCMNVVVSIFSRTGEDTFKICSRGEIFFENGGFSVHYSTDGDDCLLEFSEGIVTQRRSGNLNFTMQFAEGRQTECMLTEGGSGFSFPIFTHVLGVSFSEDSGCTVTLRYSNGAENELTELVFTAERERVPNERRTPRAR